MDISLNCIRYQFDMIEDCVVLDRLIWDISVKEGGGGVES